MLGPCACPWHTLHSVTSNCGSGDRRTKKFVWFWFFFFVGLFSFSAWPTGAESIEVSLDVFSFLSFSLFYLFLLWLYTITIFEPIVTAKMKYLSSFYSLSKAFRIWLPVCQSTSGFKWLLSTKCVVPVQGHFQ